MNSNQNNSDQRKHVRNNFIHNFEVLDVETGLIIGDLADITVEGIMLICDGTVELEKKYHLQINLDGKVGELETLSFVATAVRSINTNIDELFSVGFKILDIEPKTQKTLKYLIDEFGLDYNK